MSIWCLRAAAAQAQARAAKKKKEAASGRCSRLPYQSGPGSTVPLLPLPLRSFTECWPRTSRPLGGLYSTLLNITQPYSTLLNITQHYSTPLSGHKATFRCKEATRTAHNSQSQPPSRRQQEDTTGYRRIKRQVRDGERLLSRFGQNEVEHLYISTSTMYLLRLSTTWLYDIVWVLIWI